MSDISIPVCTSETKRNSIRIYSVSKNCSHDKQDIIKATQILINVVYTSVPSILILKFIIEQPKKNGSY